MACLKESCREIRAGCRVRAPGYVPSLGPKGEQPVVPGLRLEWSIQMRKRVLVSFTGVLSKGHTGGKLWRWGDCLPQGHWDSRQSENLHQELTCTYDSAGCFMGHAFYGARVTKKLVSIQGPYGQLGCTKWVWRPQYYAVTEQDSQ